MLKSCKHERNKTLNLGEKLVFDEHDNILKISAGGSKVNVEAGTDR